MKVIELIDEALDKLEDGNYLGCGKTLKQLRDDVIKSNLEKELNVIVDLENDIKWNLLYIKARGVKNIYIIWYNIISKRIFSEFNKEVIISGRERVSMFTNEKAAIKI